MQKFIVLFPLLLFPAALPAGHVIPLSLEELSRDSELILEGRVTSKSCQRDSAGRIYTQVELQVAHVWKGSATNELFTLVHGGGILGDRRVSVSDQVDFQPGEEVVVFLAFNRSREAVCLGMAQGKFHVWTDRNTKEKYARSPFHGGDPGSPAAAARPASARDLLPLAELKRRVSRAIQ